MALGAFFGEAGVGAIAVGVGEGEALEADFGFETSGGGEFGEEEGTLAVEVGAGLGVEGVVVEDGVVEEEADETGAERAVAGVGSVGVLGFEEGGEAGGEIGGGDEGGAATGGEEEAEDRAAHVVECIGLAVVEEFFFVTLHAAEHAEGDEQAERMHKIATAGEVIKGPEKTGGGEGGIGGEGDREMLGEAAEGDLTIAAFEGGESEAKEDVAGAGERFAAAGLQGGARGVGGIGGDFAEARGFGGDHEAPIGVVGEPVGEPFAVAAYEREGDGSGTVGDEERILEEGAKGGAAFFVDERFGGFAEAGESGALGGAAGGSWERRGGI
jgi:hypothetical protein